MKKLLFLSLSLVTVGLSADAQQNFYDARDRLEAAKEELSKWHPIGTEEFSQLHKKALEDKVEIYKAEKKMAQTGILNEQKREDYRHALDWLTRVEQHVDTSPADLSKSKEMLEKAETALLAAGIKPQIIAKTGSRY